MNRRSAYDLTFPDEVFITLHDSGGEEPSLTTAQAIHDVPDDGRQIAVYKIRRVITSAERRGEKVNDEGV